jgi:hypothetical protein
MLWWKTVRTHDLPEGGTVVIGDPDAISKLWFVFWRFQHKWTVFRVDTDKPYWVFFEDSKTQMRYKKKIETQWFVARIGSPFTRFVAACNLEDAESLPIEVSSMRFNWFQVNVWIHVRPLSQGRKYIFPREITII